MKTAKKYGCKDFIGYLPDTFGHSQNVVEILRDFGINKCVVWRGCGDFPAEFKWCGMDTVNLVRGYFNDVFSIKTSIEKKAELLKDNLEKIAEKSDGKGGAEKSEESESSQKQLTKERKRRMSFCHLP